MPNGADKMSEQQPKRVSNKALLKATGKDWTGWFQILDEKGAAKMTHKEIAAMLLNDGFLSPEKAWWAQGITVAYEFEHGRRVVGETLDAGFNIGVQKTLSIRKEKLWDFLMSEYGRALWLGGTSADFLPEKGAAYTVSNGTKGEIRSVSRHERLRLTWQPVGWDLPSTLQLYLLETKDKTSLRFHQEKLSGPPVREAMKRHWAEVLERIQKESDSL